MFDERDVTHVPAHKREIAMVFQSYALYPQKTVFENIAFGLRLRRVPGTEIDSKVRPPPRSSRSIICSTAARTSYRADSASASRSAAHWSAIPSVFLMDEPLSNLDAALRISMRVLIKRLHGAMGTTFVYVTHDQAEAMTLADRITVMRDGKIQQIDTPDGIYERPANRFVAGFLGAPQMNFIDGELVDDGSGGLMFARETLRLPVGARKGASPGRPVVLGLRPEDVGLGSAGGARIAGRVTLISPLGSEQHVNLASPAGEIVVRLAKIGQGGAWRHDRTRRRSAATASFRSDLGASLGARQP